MLLFPILQLLVPFLVFLITNLYFYLLFLLSQIYFGCANKLCLIMGLLLFFYSLDGVTRYELICQSIPHFFLFKSFIP